MKMPDLATALASEAAQNTVDIRRVERLHAQLVGPEDSPDTDKSNGHVKMPPVRHDRDATEECAKAGVKSAGGSECPRNTNSAWMPVDAPRACMAADKAKIGAI